MTIEILTYIAIIVLAIMGAPIFIIMALLALFAFYFAGVETSAVVVDIYKIANTPTLLTIPLFTFAGYMMAASQTPARILRLAKGVFGWLPGGVAILTLAICAFFTAFTGASGVTIVALGGLLLPMLLKEGYSERFSVGFITSAGSVGLLFPPSLPIILYGIIARVDIQSLFIAGAIPCLVSIGVRLSWAYKHGLELPKQTTPFSIDEFWGSIYGARYIIPLPIFILVGIYGGFVTASEAAALMAAYVFITEFFLHKDIQLTSDLPRIIKESMSMVGSILLILCCAMGITNYLVDEEIPMQILEVLKLHISNKYLFLVYLNLFLLIVGCMMDIFSAIIIVVPIILPVAYAYDIHPIHLAIIFLTNLEIGYITPPVGLNLFFSSFRFKKPIIDVYKASFPFLFLAILALILITYIPKISLIWF